MRQPSLRMIHADELIVDNFAGGGGASLGIEIALGRSPDIAINHDREAIALHAANHPTTKHYVEDVWAVDPVAVTAGKRVALAWFSPDCKHFSKAKGGKPVEKKIRGLAWVAVKWAKALGPERQPRVIVLENVEEFADWGPLLEDGRPCPLRRGMTFRRFCRQLTKCGYTVDVRELRACDYGAPTIRKRLFLIARCDGQPIVWPQPTHAKDGAGGLLPWLTAASCIEWSLPCPSIFERARPLATNTLRRIARGVMRYVVNAANPFIVRCAHGETSPDGARRWGAGEHDLAAPVPTVTASKDFALVAPVLAGVGGRAGQSPERPGDAPMGTITAKGDTALVAPVISAFYGDKGASSERCHEITEPLRTQTADPRFALVAPTLIQTGYGERPGQAPRVPGLDKPLGTCVDGQKHALVSAFLAKHYGDTGQRPGSDLREPVSTVTACDHNALVTAQLELPLTAAILNHNYTSNTCGGQGSPLEPMKTVTTGGHHSVVKAFLMKYYGTGGQYSAPAEPMHTLPANDRMGLVTVHGIAYEIVDIGMRMLQPRELFRAQGFPDSYVIAPTVNDKPLTKTAQVRMCGNSVCPPLAAAIVGANLGAQISAAVA